MSLEEVVRALLVAQIATLRIIGSVLDLDARDAMIKVLEGKLQELEEKGIQDV